MTPSAIIRRRRPTASARPANSGGISSTGTMLARSTCRAAFASIRASRFGRCWSASSGGTGRPFSSASSRRIASRSAINRPTVSCASLSSLVIASTWRTIGPSFPYGSTPSGDRSSSAVRCRRRARSRVGRTTASLSPSAAASPVALGSPAPSRSPVGPPPPSPSTAAVSGPVPASASAVCPSSTLAHSLSRSGPPCRSASSGGDASPSSSIVRGRVPVAGPGAITRGATAATARGRAIANGKPGPGRPGSVPAAASAARCPSSLPSARPGC